MTQHLPTLGPKFPFQLLVGSHEDQDGQDGYILNHAACLPDRLGSTGTYGVHYYFDYPASSPLMRVIMIPPNMRVENVLYNYTPAAHTMLGSLRQSIAPGLRAYLGLPLACTTSASRPASRPARSGAIS